MPNFVKIVIPISLLANLFLWMFLRVAMQPEALPVILHYQATLGPDLFGTWQGVFSLPLVGIIIIAINLILAYFLNFKRKKLVLLGACLISQFFLTIGGIMIVLVN